MIINQICSLTLNMNCLNISLRKIQTGERVGQRRHSSSWRNRSEHWWGRRGTQVSLAQALFQLRPFSSLGTWASPGCCSTRHGTRRRWPTTLQFLLWHQKSSSDQGWCRPVCRTTITAGKTRKLLVMVKS